MPPLLSGPSFTLSGVLTVPPSWISEIYLDFLRCAKSSRASFWRAAMRHGGVLRRGMCPALRRAWRGHMSCSGRGQWLGNRDCRCPTLERAKRGHGEGGKRLKGALLHTRAWPISINEEGACRVDTQHWRGQGGLQSALLCPVSCTNLLVDCGMIIRSMCTPLKLRPASCTLPPAPHQGPWPPLANQNPGFNDLKGMEQCSERPADFLENSSLSIGLAHLRINLRCAKKYPYQTPFPVDGQKERQLHYCENITLPKRLNRLRVWKNAFLLQNILIQYLSLVFKIYSWTLINF